MPPGKYVVAVSGGVDSMVLLDVLVGQTGLELIVAHFNHGIREDADEDERLVREAAAKYDLAYIYDKVRLGAGASEDVARRARYGFLLRVAREHSAKIITAHHQDDVLETAILNILRGTGRRGLSSLRSNEEIVRPLLNVPKKEIMAYAQELGLTWHEDSTNADERYLRNYVRHRIVPRLGKEGRSKMLARLQTAGEHNDEIEMILRELLPQNATTFQRAAFTMLPHDVSLEFLAAILRNNNVRDFNARELQRLVAAIKTLPPGKRVDVHAGDWLEIGKTDVKLTTTSVSQNKRFNV